jgi:hypothetical protein
MFTTLGQVSQETKSKAPGFPLDGLVINGIGYTTIQP